MDDRATAEWHARRAVCRLLERAGIDVDDARHDTLTRSIRHYAATYADLYEGTGKRHPQAEDDARRMRPILAHEGAS
jgi:hypothetical protein